LSRRLLLHCCTERQEKIRLTIARQAIATGVELPRNEKNHNIPPQQPGTKKKNEEGRKRKMNWRRGKFFESYLA
jgi:hypothetical protein